MTDSPIFQRIKEAVRAGRVRLSDHALTRMLERGIDIVSTLDGLERAIIVEDYASTRGEPRVLVAATESAGRELHMVWDAPQTPEEDAVLVTVFYPDR